ncbi:hypothetical protein [Tepidibacter hydrothermalis]|uniref:Uncharacterized protein n=1 Tax=Tepidibacter hydrothermalis TaxID=3036126 RepID=A0ABY8EGD4_9FIRM|nr:hypothetical protein [Tepidibacter hydrothermalis]WFD11996.1 hypothetical protein P4S50_07935 [Tepidibacter hydrothermalis]
MSSIGKIRVLLETMRGVAHYLTDEEISEIGVVLLKAMSRMEKEQEVNR